MTKHRRWSDKPKTDSIEKSTPELKNKENFPTNSSKDFKSLILSGTKYAYIIAAAALFSGIFTPLTLGLDVEEVIFGILSILLGLGGGVTIFFGIKYQNLTTILVSGGLGMIVISLILIYELANRSLF
tara:strand:+ start:312 stop:695 length:384 start_codon:yes stop_codon:yes gene_type:complete